MIIGIVHHDSTKEFLEPLLNSLKGVKYPVYVIHNNKRPLTDGNHYKQEVRVIYNTIGGYELGALKRLLEANPKEDEFFLLQETTVIKDLEIFDYASHYVGSFALSPGFMHFMGKYRRSALELIGIPVPQARLAAIYYEYFWNIVYINLEKNIAMSNDPLPVESGVFEEKFGRRNMVIENKYIKKWKSNWGQDIKNPPQSFIPKI